MCGQFGNGISLPYRTLSTWGAHPNYWLLNTYFEADPWMTHVKSTKIQMVGFTPFPRPSWLAWVRLRRTPGIRTPL